MRLLQYTRPSDSTGERWAVGLGSKMVSILFSVAIFVFYAFSTFKYSYSVHVAGGGSQTVTEYFTGYEALSVPYFKDYASFFMILSMVLALLAVIFVGIEIYSLKDAHGPDLIILNLEVLVLEFMLKSFSTGGILLFVFACINYVQYFALQAKHKELDYWVFLGMLVLDLALLPSALVSSNLFLG